MKKNMKRVSITSALLALLLAVCLCFAVAAADNSGVTFSCEGTEEGVTTVALSLTGLDSKAVDYVQLTLEAPAGLCFVADSAAAADSGLEAASHVNGSTMTVLLIPVNGGFAGVGEGKLLSFCVTGAKDTTDYTFSGNMILCYTDGTDAEKEVSGTITTPVGSVTARLEAETDAVLWRYPATSENGLSGTVAGNIVLGNTAGMQTFEALSGGAWLDKSQQPMASFTVDVPTGGTYTLQVAYRLGMSAGDKSNYFLTLSVDDAAYYKSMHQVHPDNSNYSQGTFDIMLTAGRHLIRVLPVIADVRTDALKVGWLNLDYMDVTGPGQVTAVAPQQTHLQSGNAPYMNMYTPSTEFTNSAAWLNCTVGGYSAHVNTKNAGITPENFTVYQLNNLGWFSYTLNVPADGYYDLQTYMNTGWRGTGDVLMLIDGVKHIVPVSDAVATSFDYNAQNLSCYLTKGTHTVLISGILGHTADPKGNGGYVDWCNLGALSVSGGITLAETQVDPATWAEPMADVYVSTTGNDNALGTADAPVASLNVALKRVKAGGAIHIIDSYTAASDFSWYAAEGTVTITGGTLDLTALSLIDLNCPVIFDNVTVKIADGASIYCCGNKVKINQNVTISGVGYIFGGKYDASVASTDLTVFSGTWLGIYGGGGSASTRGDVTGTANLTVGGNINPGIDISDHNIENHVYGGSRRGAVAVTNLTVNGGKISKVYGGGSGVKSADWCDFGTTNVTINGGTMMGVYGGNAFGAGYKDGSAVTNVTINGGVMDQVFGGSEWASVTGTTVVRVNGGEITRRVFGGCYNSSSTNHVAGTTYLILGEGVNFSKSYGIYESITARSRSYNETAETAYLFFTSQAAYDKLYKELASDPADNTYKDTVTGIKEWNLILAGDVTVNFYAAMGADMEQNAVLNITLNGKTLSYSASDVLSDSAYKLSANMAAAQMTDEITVELVVGEVVITSKTYTIRQYADTILNGDYSDETKALVREMLCYGGAAQQYFGYHTDAPANMGITSAGADVPGAADQELTVSGSVDGISFYGASLVFDYKVGLRFYFETDADIGSYTFSTGADPVSKGGRYYVEVSGIKPQNLNDPVTLTVTKDGQTLTVSYSPMNYIVRKYQSTESATLQALLKAMYNYHIAADAYIRSLA